MKRARNAAYWIAPPLLCLLLYWSSFTAWFRGDDFAWLGLGLRVHNFSDFLGALFLPAAQGTIRPWSERLFFMAGFALFGLDPLPFRIVIFATQFANLTLVAAIGARLSASRAAGFCAAILWTLNGAMVEPLGWACVYNQVMCAFYLLLALYFLLRSIEAAQAPDLHRARFFEALQWLAFLLGLGAQELNVLYPVLAACYTFLSARSHFRRTLPLFAVSALYILLHRAAAPLQQSGDYALHFTASLLRILAKYWTWSVGPIFLQEPFHLPSWVIPASIALLTAGLLIFLAGRLRAGVRGALFPPAWYLVTIAPVLPLRDHVTEYYIYVPLIGLAWMGGWAISEAWRSPARARIPATALALLYAVTVMPRAAVASQWNHQLTAQVRTLVEGVAGAHQLHPGQGIVLEGVDTSLFYNGILDHPFRAIGIDKVYLAPGSEQRIDTHPDWGDPAEFILPADVTAQGIEKGELVVYDVRGPRLRNITARYTPPQANQSMPVRLDVADPLTAYLLGPEWYPRDSDHRWMPQRATLRMAAPASPGRKLYLHGYCTPEQLQAGPLALTVAVDGTAFPAAAIPCGGPGFELSFPLPDAVVGHPEMHVSLEVTRTFRPPSDPRDLGLAFGTFEIR